MNIRRFTNNTDAVKAIANELRMFIEDNENPMWLLSGGSNIPIQIQVSKQLSDQQKKKLTVALVDERFGEGSSFEQLKKSGFDFGTYGEVYNINSTAGDLEAAANEFDKYITDAAANRTWFVQLGFGANGHVAGNVPETEVHDVVYDSKNIRAFVADDFKRITLKEDFINKSTKIVLFASGDKKIEKFEVLTHAETTTPLKEVAHLHQTTTYLSEGA
ncbi:TPA: hypothetical protein EYO12_00865 [Candidatus Saccharibacteria bacterium]|nr:hypothetical protein [Candidatus Saccharibacteria bacterium]HIO87269.1 hypothetical protein [Candidatus Saccharibacteria bacterium]